MISHNDEQLHDSTNVVLLQTNPLFEVLRQKNAYFFLAVCLHGVSESGGLTVACIYRKVASNTNVNEWNEETRETQYYLTRERRRTQDRPRNVAKQSTRE